MNKIYKVIWSKTRNCYVAVSELAKNHGKDNVRSETRGIVKGASALALCIALSLGVTGSVWADDPENPEDPTITKVNFDMTEHITGKETLDSDKYKPNTLPEGSTDNSIFGFGNSLSSGFNYQRGAQNIWDYYYGYTSEKQNQIKNGWSGLLADGNNMIVGSANTLGGKDSLIIGNGNEMIGQDISKHMSYNMYGWQHGSGWKERTDTIHAPAESSIIIGINNKLGGNQSVVIGSNSSADGDSSNLVSSSYDTNTPSWFSPLGYNSNNTVKGGENNTAVGESSHSTGFFNTAIGQGSIAAGEYVRTRDEFDYRQYNGESVGVAIKPPAIKHETTKGSVNSTAVGQNAIAIGNQNTALGQGAAVYGGVTEESENYWSDWMYDAMQDLSGKDWNGGKLDHKVIETFTAASKSTAIGENAVAVGDSNTVIGQGSRISNYSSTYYGHEYEEGFSNSTAVGQGTFVHGNKSTAIGQGSSVNGENSTAIGQGVGVQGHYNIAAGSGVTIYDGDYNVAVGYETRTGSFNGSGSGDNNTAVGSRSTASGTSNSSYGDSSGAIGYNSTALGSQSRAGFQREIWENDRLIGFAHGGNDTAVGQGSTAMGHNNVAVGTGSVAGNWSDLSFEQRMNRYITSEQEASIQQEAQQEADRIARNGLPEDASNWNYYQQQQYMNIYSQALPGLYNQKLNDAIFKQWQQGKDAQGNNVISDEFSTAVGSGATAAGAGQTAIGGMAKAPGWHATAVGLGSKAEGASAIAIGESANTHDNQEIAIGNYAQTYGQSSIAVGRLAGGNTNYAIAIGDNATVQYRPEEQWVVSGYNDDGTAIVEPDKQTNHVQRLVADQSIAIGRNSYVDGKDATAVGRNTEARMRNATAYGNNAHANAWNSIAIGNKATAGLKENIFDSTSGDILADVKETDENELEYLIKGAAAGNSAVAVGNRARAISEYTTAVGAGTNAEGWHAVAVGDSNQATGKFSTAVGAGWSINHTDGEDDLDNTTDDETGDGINTEGKRTYESIGANQASGDYSTAVGYGNAATSESTLAVGNLNKIGGLEIDDETGLYKGDKTATGSMAFGVGNTITGKQSIAVGTGHEISADNSGAFGDPDKVYANASYVIGNDNAIGEKGKKEKGINTFVVGNNVTTDKANTVVFGHHTKKGENEKKFTFGENSVSLGFDAVAKETDNVALGSTSVANRKAANGGAGAGFDVTTGTNYIGKGADSPTWKSTLGAVSVGGTEDDTDAAIGSAATATRQITGVAAGTADTDAVNVAQLKLAVGGTTYTAGDNVTINEDNEISAGDTTYTFNDTTEEAQEKDPAIVQQTTVIQNNPDGTTQTVATINDTDTITKVTSKDKSVTITGGDVVDGVITYDLSVNAVNANDTTYTAEQSVDAGDDWKKGSTTFTITDSNGDELDPMTIQAGDNITITEGEKGEAVIKARNTTYTADQSVDAGDDWGKGSTKFTITDSDGNDLKPMTVKAGKNVKITKGDNGEAVIEGNGLDNKTYEVNENGEVTFYDQAGNHTTITGLNANNDGAITRLGDQITNLDNKIEKVGAGAAALAGLHPLDFDPDEKWDFAASVGSYRSEQAVAIGAFYRPNEDTMFSIGGTIGNGNNMVNVGVSWKFGQKNRISANRISSAKEIIELRKNQEDVHSFLADAVAGNQLDLSKIQLFPDVEENHWAYDYVATMAGNGVLEGYPDGYFKGNRNMTRYEMAAVLYRLMQNGARLSDRALTEFAPELDRIRVDTITKHKDGTPHIQRVRTIKERVDEKSDLSSEKAEKKKAKIKVAEKPME